MNRFRRGLLYPLEWWIALPWPPPARATWLWLLGAKIGSQAVIHRCRFMNLEVHGFRALSVGSSAHVGPDCLLDLAEPISVGDRAALSPRVMILTHEEPASPLLLENYPRREGPVVIEDDAWIGAGATILHGVRVGKAAVVGAGSLVRHDVPPGVTVVGSPARPIAAGEKHV
jgi:acetyltransferase-like isoleucine patch superfamily enzyme